MHEKERHRIILSAVQEKPVVTVQEMVDLTDSSEATIRRDIAALHVQKRLRRVRGGAEALSPPQFIGLAGRPFSVNETLHAAEKRAIAREAVALCGDGEPIIINGGTTTFQMVHFLANRRMTVFTNSFPIAEHLLKHSKNTVMLSGGTIYREQNIILSPFDNDVTRNFYARRMFMGARGLGPLGLMEGDPLLIQAEQKLIDQADELVVLVELLEVPAALQPDPVRTGAHRHRHHRRRASRTARQRCSKMPASGWLSPKPVCRRIDCSRRRVARDGWQRLGHDRKARRADVRGVGKGSLPRARWRKRGRAADGRFP